MNKKGNAVLIVVILLVVLLVGAGIFFMIKNKDNSSNNVDNTTQSEIVNTGKEIYDNAKQTADDAVSSINSMVVNSYNQRYEIYVGKNKTASETKSLYSLINANNADDNRLEGNTITYEGPSKAEITSPGYYDISVEYGSNGLINKVIVTPKTSRSE